MLQNVTDQETARIKGNEIHDKIGRRINSGNANYYSVCKLFSSRLLSKTQKVRICKPIILPVVCEIRLRTLWKDVITSV
jgi:hypothetical protein